MSTEPKHTPEPLLNRGITIYRLVDDLDKLRQRQMNAFSAMVNVDTRVMTEDEGIELAKNLVAAYNATFAAGINPSAIQDVVEALEKIAAWGEGPEVTSSFDEPGSAHIARQALVALKQPVPSHE